MVQRRYQVHPNAKPHSQKRNPTLNLFDWITPAQFETINVTQGDLHEVATRYGNKDSYDDTTSKKSQKKRLHKNRVLDLAQGWLFDPRLTVEDLSDEISLPVFLNPWFILEAVASVRRQGVDA